MVPSRTDNTHYIVYSGGCKTYKTIAPHHGIAPAPS